MSKDFEEFMRSYDPEGTRVKYTADLQDQHGDSDFIVVRYGDRTIVLTLMGLSDHLCIDAHPFIAGKDAFASAFAMWDGRRNTLEPLHGVPTPTSHGFNGGGLVAILLGEQGEAAEPAVPAPAASTQVPIVMVDGEDLAAVLRDIDPADGDIRRLRFAFDGGIKVKVNEHSWSLPRGEVSTVDVGRPAEPAPVHVTPVPVEGIATDRIARALQDGMDAFWAQVTTVFPEVESGDMDPGGQLTMEDTMARTLAAWLEYNHPDAATEDPAELPTPMDLFSAQFTTTPFAVRDKRPDVDWAAFDTLQRARAYGNGTVYQVDPKTGIYKEVR